MALIYQVTVAAAGTAVALIGGAVALWIGIVRVLRTLDRE